MVEDLSIHNKVHTFWGELIQGAATVVHLPDDIFNLSSKVQVPTLMSAKILLAANATLGEPDTETFCTRKVCILPAKYLGGWSHVNSWRRCSLLSKLTATPSPSSPS